MKLRLIYTTVLSCFAFFTQNCTSMFSSSKWGIEIEKVFNGQQLEVARLCTNGKPDRLRDFLEANSNVDLNKRGFEDMTLLYWAIGEEADRCVQILLTYGADPNQLVATEKGTRESVLAIATGNKSEAIFRSLLKAGADPNGTYRLSPATVVAMDNRRFERLKDLLDAGADINAIDEASSNSLPQAASSMMRYDYVIYLLRRGANYEYINGRGADLAFKVSNHIGYPNKEMKPYFEECVAFLESKGYGFPNVHPNNR